MPLIKSQSSAAFKSNLKAELASGRPKNQALAIAYRVQRDAKRKKMAKGGRVKGYAPGGAAGVGMSPPPFWARNAARAAAQPGGIIGSAVPGRSDQIPMGVKGGSYLIPADVVSALGQGNSMAGARGLSRLFKTGPYGVNVPKVAMPSGRRGFAPGGAVDDSPVDIMAAGGEFVVPAESVAEIGGGDMKSGHDILDSFVKQTRKRAIRTLRKLPGPKKR